MGRLIDADVLMEEMKTPVLIDNEKAIRIWEGWHECTIALKEAIDRTPTIEERKTGTWNGTQNVECDQCGHLYPAFMRLEKYCPSCGARMVQEGGQQ